jgi:hypothetical protein
VKILDWNGEPITEPGAYRGVLLDAYHGADLCDGPSVSSSGLRTIEAESPAHYWLGSPLNPDRESEDQKPALNLGSAAHTLLLGESGFRGRFAVRPEEFPDWKTKASKDWRESMVAEGRQVITPEDVATIKGMAASLARHPLVASGLLQGEVEVTLAWKDAETGIWLKARPDVLPRDTILVDLKTCASAAPVAVRRAIAERGYHMQLALAGEGMKATLGIEPGNDDYVLVFVETAPPYCVNVKPVAAETIQFGRRQIRRALRRFADCLSRGEWPGYDDDGVTAYLPGWAQKQLETEAEMGLLPEVA